MTPMASRKEHRDGSEGTQPGSSVVLDVAKRIGILAAHQHCECFRLLQIAQIITIGICIEVPLQQILVRGEVVGQIVAWI